MKTELIDQKQTEAKKTAYPYALTYTQLIRQGLEKKMTQEELVRLRKAYDLAEQLFDGFYRGQGMPFVCHLVRTASIVLHEDFPMAVVTAAMLHGAYLMGQFEDGVSGKTTAAHRRYLRQELGVEAEALVLAYNELPWGTAEALGNHLNHLESSAQEKKQLLVMRLANELEDHLDLAMAYRGGLDAKKRIRDLSGFLVELAQKMNLRLTPDLQQAYQEHLETDLPAGVIRTHKHCYEHPERVWQKKPLKKKAEKLFVKGNEKHLPESKKMISIPLNSKKIFYELDPLREDRALTTAVEACICLHQALGESAMAAYKPNPQAEFEVSAEALERILQRGEEVHGIGAQRSISNCIVFNASNIANAITHAEIQALRRRIFKLVSDHVDRMFPRENVETHDSGHFLYPPGGYMGWHTNYQTPGWRLYINYAEEAGKSFFRYRNPETGEIVTSWDKQWNFRLFKIDPKKAFWHAVYSQTNRYSFGFKMIREVRPGFVKRAWKKLAALAV